MTDPETSPFTDSNEPPAAPDVSPAAPRPAPSGVTSWMLLSLVVIGLVAGASVVMLMKSSPQNVSAATNTGAPAVRTSTVETARTAITPQWSGGVRRLNGRNVAVYELEADNDVALWGKVVRPVLTIRCIAGTTEVFVFTQSAAAIDGDDGKHAVRLGFDGEAASTERWMASDEYDALFAENGVSAARRVAGARTMRFGFTPYNAAPVTATFQVTGFDKLAPKLAQTCRWK